MNAPRVTLEDIHARIESEHYFTGGDGVHGSVNGAACSYPESLSRLTFCVLVLVNGFTVTGESSCASPENFDAEIGRKIAKTRAIDKVWPLLGYELRTRLSEQGLEA